MNSLATDLFSLQFVKILASVWLVEALVYVLVVYFRAPQMRPRDLLETVPLLMLGGLGLLIAIPAAAWLVDRTTHFTGKNQAVTFVWIILVIALLRIFFQTWVFADIMGRIARMIFVIIVALYVVGKVLGLIAGPVKK
jgi:hypothetical protein